MKTSYGLSDETCDTRELEDKLLGILQSNSAASITLFLISMPLLNLLWKKGYSGKFLSHISKHQNNLVDLAFVDDTDLIMLDMIDRPLGFDEITEKYKRQYTCGKVT